MDKVLNFLSLSSGPAYTVTGTYSYYVEVSIKGESPYQTSTISITAFTKPDKKIAIAVSCKWYRVQDDRQYRLATIHSNTYQLSAEDLGYLLKIEVTPLEEDQKGTAVVQYGPIRLDPNVRSTLESILGAGGSRFPIQFVDEETGMISREPAALAMTSEYIRVVETPPVGKEKEVKFRYNYDIPKVELNYLDCTRLYFLFSGEEEDCENVKKFLGIKKSVGCKLGVKFLSRTARDLVILTLKCFATKTYLLNSMVINEVAFTPGKIFKDKKEAPQQIGDTLLEVDSIKREMYLVLLRNQELTKDKELLQHSVKRLEEELSSTIETYSQLINEVRSTSDISQTTENAGEYRKRAETLEDEVKKLRRRVQELEDERALEGKGAETDRRDMKARRVGTNDEIVNIQQDFEKLSERKENPNIFSLEYEMKLQDLEEENEKLKARNEGLLEELRHYKGRGSVPAEMPRMNKGRAANDESFFIIENKLSDTKKLNEMLIKQVNDLKAKNNSMHKEIDMLREEVSKLREGDKSEQITKEKSYRQEKEALEKEIQRLKEENVALHKDKTLAQSMSGSMTERLRNEEQQVQLTRKVEGLQKENSELREKVAALERAQAKGFNSLNSSETGFSPMMGTPVKRGPEPFEQARNQINEEFFMKVRTDLDMLARDAVGWKGRSTMLELELEKLRRENGDLKARNMQMEHNRSNLGSPSNFMSPAKDELINFVDKTVMNTSRTYEVLLTDSKKENDRLYGEIVTLKSRLTLLECNYHATRLELERTKKAGSAQPGMENEIMMARKEAQAFKEEAQKLNGEVESLRMTINIQMSREERERLIKERDQARAEIEGLMKAKGNQPELEAKIKELEGKISEKTREIEIMRAELENNKTKNGSLLKEIEYLRGEVNNLRRKDESILAMADMRELESEYKEKIESLQQENKKLEKELGALKAAAMKRKSDNTEELEQMNELLRKEVLEYKKKIEELEQQGRKSLRETGYSGNVDKENMVDEELRKRNRLLEVEMQNQRKRIADLEKENERFRLVGSLRECTNEDSFIGREKERGGHDKSKEELERLRSENESLIQQRTQLSRKVESLAKELESKVGVKTNQAMLENLAKTNEKLIQENARLMEELENARYGSRMDNSRLDNSRYEDNDRDRVRELQYELSSVTAERDQLLVEMSKMKALEKNKRIFI